MDDIYEIYDTVTKQPTFWSQTLGSQETLNLRSVLWKNSNENSSVYLRFHEKPPFK